MHIADDLIYQKVEKYLEDLFKKGKLKEGDRLLPEKEIGRLFKASVKPVRRAMQKYLDRGILEKRRGRGTFVKNLRSKKAVTGRIAVLHCYNRHGFFNSSFYSAIMAGIEAQAQVEEKIPMVIPLFKEGNINPAFYQLTRDAEGIIQVGAMPRLIRKIRTAFEPLDIPIVVLDYEGDAGGLDTIVTDSVGTTTKLVRFLIGQGHRRIAFADRYPPGEIHPNSVNRLKGYAQALEEQGLSVDDSLIQNFHVSPREPGRILENPDPELIPPLYEKQVAMLQDLLDRPDPPTAFVCAGDYIALFLYDLARLLGLTIPDDLSVAGYDNIRDAARVSPGLTTTHSPLLEMGGLAVSRILEKIREKERGLVTISHRVLPGEVVVRESHKYVP